METPSRQRAAVILAAGKGTRMKSDLPKVMHKVAGRPMVDWSIALARQVGCERIVVVAHPSQKVLIDHVGPQLGEQSIAFQDPPMGTGHAVRCAEDALAGFDGDLRWFYMETALLCRQRPSKACSTVSPITLQSACWASMPRSRVCTVV